MDQLIPIIIVVLVAVILIIWWWSRRSDERPPDEPYHANPFVGTSTYETPPAAHEPAAPAAEPGESGAAPEAIHATPAMQTEPEAAPAPAASDAATTVPELVLGDESAVPTETVVAEQQLNEMAGHTTTQEVPASVPPPPAEPAAPVAPEPMPEPPAATAAPEVPAAPPPAPAETKSDDFTKIEGIGPRISSVLQAAGIRTFEQLAGAKPAAIKELLTQAKLHTADPATWPQQARLAAAGKWEQLKTLQDKLDGGRKV